MKIYLAGPITGIENDNIIEFARIKTLIENDGYCVTTPFDLEIPKPKKGTDKQEVWNYYMRHCLNYLLSGDVEMVILLEGWQSSKGASSEAYVAQKANIPVKVFHEKSFGNHYLSDIGEDESEETEDILLEANGLVNGDRNNSYGHPYYDYTKTAGFWSIVLKDKLKKDLTPEDAIMCMMLMKISREMNKHKKDNLTDLAGYAQCLQKTILKRIELEDRDFPQG